MSKGDKMEYEKPEMVKHESLKDITAHDGGWTCSLVIKKDDEDHDHHHGHH